MVTPDLIEKQYQLERQQVKQGKKRLKDNTMRLENKDYASASVYGISCIDDLLPKVVAELDRLRYRIREGHNGVAFAEIRTYLDELETLAVAGIGCKLTFDKVFGYKENSNLLQNITEAIGSALEDECQMRYYERTAPGLLKTLKDNYWHAACGTHQKLSSIQTLINRTEIEEWKAWNRKLRVKLGTWVLDSIFCSVNWFTLQRWQNQKKTSIFVVPTAEFLEVKDNILSEAELFAPLKWPMLIPPKDWSNETPGGYLTNELMLGNDLVRRGDPCRLQGEKPLEFLNRIQKVAYALNPFIVSIAEHLEERGRKVGKFIPIIEIPLPPKPVDIADNYDARKTYRRAAAEVMNKNADAFRRSCRTRMTMEAVRKFKNIERFWIPHSYDYRGRCYPIPPFLTPQDTDFGKALLRFADTAPINDRTKEWLAFQVATTYGKDKDTLEERREWVYKNHDLITYIATDPVGSLPEWESASEPFCFLAACEEYYACIISCTRDFTCLPVAVDATCSGLQILAGLARDASTARMVNVLPGDKPQDAYRVIAEASKPNVPEELHEFWDRKVTKRTVMTVPYNAKPFSNRSYIRAALKEKGVEVSKEQLTQLVKAVRDAMDRVVPGPMAVMKWVESEVAKALKDGAERIEWTTPSGFIVTQKLMKRKLETIELQLMGRVQMKIATGDTDKVDVTHHKNATAPNLIHSLDASLLHETGIRFGAPLAIIHDSVLTRACDMDQLSNIIREMYMYIFSEREYLKEWAEQIGAQTEPPMIGDLEPGRVLKSTYFFC